MTEQIFEWDRRKAAANVRKHGIDFNEAREVFFDPLKKLEMEGMEHGEIRWQSAKLLEGYSSSPTRSKKAVKSKPSASSRRGKRRDANVVRMKGRPRLDAAMQRR